MFEVSKTGCDRRHLFVGASVFNQLFSDLVFRSSGRRCVQFYSLDTWSYISLLSVAAAFNYQMPLFTFPRLRSSKSDLDLDYSSGRPRVQANEPPPLSSTDLFDPFPRIVFGGYTRYYYSETACIKQAYNLGL